MVCELKIMYCQEISWYTVYHCRIKHKLSKPKSALQIITQRCWSENCFSGFKLTFFLQKSLLTRWRYDIISSEIVPFLSLVCKKPHTGYTQGTRGGFLKGPRNTRAQKNLFCFSTFQHGIGTSLNYGLVWKIAFPISCSQRVLEEAMSSDSETENS